MLCAAVPLLRPSRPPFSVPTQHGRGLSLCQLYGMLIHCTTGHCHFLSEPYRCVIFLIFWCFLLHKRDQHLIILSVLTLKLLQSLCQTESW